jgi:hypothetical protein
MSLLRACVEKNDMTMSLKQAVVEAINDSGIMSVFHAAKAIFDRVGYCEDARAAARIVVWEREFQKDGVPASVPIAALSDKEFQELLLLASTICASDSFDKAFESAFSDWIANQ